MPPNSRSNFQDELRSMPAGDVPLVTVVTPTLNAGRFLKESIESVLGQDYPNIEYLVVDSESTDDTRSILASYSTRLRTIQTGRMGPAAAVHLGLSQARGSILAWLNADDRYEPHAVRTAVAALMEHHQADVVYGDASWIDQNSEVIRPYPTRPFDPSMLEQDCFISQPASFFRASLYRSYSLDESLPVSFDYDLWIRISKASKKFLYLPQHLANSRMHRACLTLARRREVFEVTMALLEKHCRYVPLSWIFGYRSYLRDGRDQFFEPLRYSPVVFAATLFDGIARNRTQPLRFAAEWTRTAFRGFLRTSPEAPALKPASPAWDRAL